VPRTLSIGSSGPDVVQLQNQLNINLPDPSPLVADGIFGSQTLARVKMFQSESGLVVDGVVGPKTWAALQGGGGNVFPAQTGCRCGQHDPNNGGIGELVKSLYFQMVEFGAAFGLAAMGKESTGQSSGGSGPLRMLNRIQKDMAEPYFGDSLDFSSIFISNKIGAQGRPFTMAFPDENQTVQILNLGSFDPHPNDLIHELAHAWQSQHHPNAYAFMSAAVKCQGAAAAKNAAEVASDPNIMLHGEWPVQFPFTAYAYAPGSDVDSYGAEQVANAVEHGDGTVCATMRAAGRNVANSKNITSLTLVQYGDRRTSGIVF
jgi:hypothetical protein